MIRLQAIGHLGKDAMVNNVNGRTVINFNVAHSEKYKDGNGAVINKTVWIACAYWSDKTGIVQYLLKGTQVYVEGNPDVKTYKDNQGITHANIVLRVNNIQLLGSKREEGQTSSQPVQQQNNASNQPIASDIPQDDFSDLPF